MMKCGYMYIPKGEQIATQQEEDAFATIQCDKIFCDVTSREKDDRPEFLRTNIDPEALQRAKELHVRKEMTIPEIMNMTGFKSSAIFYKYVVNAERN